MAKKIQLQKIPENADYKKSVKLSKKALSKALTQVNKRYKSDKYRKKETARLKKNYKERERYYKRRAAKEGFEAAGLPGEMEAGGSKEKGNRYIIENILDNDIFYKAIGYGSSSDKIINSLINEQLATDGDIILRLTNMDGSQEIAKGSFRIDLLFQKAYNEVSNLPKSKKKKREYPTVSINTVYDKVTGLHYIDAKIDPPYNEPKNKKAKK